MDLQSQLAVHERRFALHEKRLDRIDKRLDGITKLIKLGMQEIAADRKRQRELWRQHREWSKDVEFHISALVAYGREQQQRMDQILKRLDVRGRNGHST